MATAEPAKATRPNSPNMPSEHERQFVAHLISLLGADNPETGTKPDRAALAALRRGLGKEPGEVAEMFPYVIPWCGNEPEYRQNDYFLVAALFASHQSRRGPYPTITNSRRNSLGGSFKQLADKTKSGSIEKRFVAMLNASREDLTAHLRYAISLLNAHEIGVDWAQLLHDLKEWEYSSRPVQRRWAEGFWYTDYSDQSNTSPGGDSQPVAAATPPSNT